jgi:periplasmic protein TonB
MNTSAVFAPEKKAVKKGPELVPGKAANLRSAYVPYHPLFSDSLLELSGIERRRRTGSTVFSLIVQSVLVIILILLPLWFTDSLPMQQLVTFLVAPPPPPAPPPAAVAHVTTTKAVSQLLNGQLLAPSKIPKKVEMIKEEEAPPSAGIAGGVIGGVPGGQAGGVIGSLISSTHQSAAPVAAEIPKRLKVSQGVGVGMLQSKVEPVYPLIALKAHVQGTVLLRAVISKEGTIENLQLIQGHPMLVEAAINAVRQWRYAPYRLSGEAVEVETTVLVNFHLDN